MYIFVVNRTVINVNESISINEFDKIILTCAIYHNNNLLLIYQLYGCRRSVDYVSWALVVVVATVLFACWETLIPSRILKTTSRVVHLCSYTIVSTWIGKRIHYHEDTIKYIFQYLTRLPYTVKRFLSDWGWCAAVKRPGGLWFFS